MRLLPGVALAVVAQLGCLFGRERSNAWRYAASFLNVGARSITRDTGSGSAGTQAVGELPSAISSTPASTASGGRVPRLRNSSYPALSLSGAEVLAPRRSYDRLAASGMVHRNPSRLDGERWH